MKKEELEQLIEEVVSKAMEKQPIEQSVGKLLTRKEVCQMLNISNPTIIDYEKRGLITSRQIGHKCYYTQEDINNALNRIQRSLRQRIKSNI